MVRLANSPPPVPAAEEFGEPANIQKFGAKPDGRIIYDAAMAAGSNLVTSASGGFADAVNNMRIVVSDAGPKFAGGAALGALDHPAEPFGCPIGGYLQKETANQVRIFAAPDGGGGAVAATSLIGPSGTHASRACYGNDWHDAIEAAWNASGNIYVPAGIYLTSTIVRNRTGFIFHGDGANLSKLVSATAGTLNILEIGNVPDDPEFAFPGIGYRASGFIIEHLQFTGPGEWGWPGGLNKSSGIWAHSIGASCAFAIWRDLQFTYFGREVLRSHQLNNHGIYNKNNDGSNSIGNSDDYFCRLDNIRSAFCGGYHFWFEKWGPCSSAKHINIDQVHGDGRYDRLDRTILGRFGPLGAPTGTDEAVGNGGIPLIGVQRYGFRVDRGYGCIESLGGNNNTRAAEGNDADRMGGVLYSGLEVDATFDSCVGESFNGIGFWVKAGQFNGLQADTHGLADDVAVHVAIDTPNETTPPVTFNRCNFGAQVWKNRHAVHASLNGAISVIGRLWNSVTDADLGDTKKGEYDHYWDDIDNHQATASRRSMVSRLINGGEGSVERLSLVEIARTTSLAIGDKPHISAPSIAYGAYKRESVIWYKDIISGYAGGGYAGLYLVQEGSTLGNGFGVKALGNYTTGVKDTFTLQSPGIESMLPGDVVTISGGKGNRTIESVNAATFTITFTTGGSATVGGLDIWHRDMIWTPFGGLGGGSEISMFGAGNIVPQVDRYARYVVYLDAAGTPTVTFDPPTAALLINAVPVPGHKLEIDFYCHTGGAGCNVAFDAGSYIQSGTPVALAAGEARKFEWAWIRQRSRWAKV